MGLSEKTRSTADAKGSQDHEPSKSTRTIRPLSLLLVSSCASRWMPWSIASDSSLACVSATTRSARCSGVSFCGRRMACHGSSISSDGMPGTVVFGDIFAVGDDSNKKGLEERDGSRMRRGEEGRLFEGDRDLTAELSFERLSDGRRATR